MKTRNLPAALAVVAPLFVMMPTAVHADAPAARSTVVSAAALPSGAVRMESAALQHNFGRLLADWAKEREMEARADGPVEVISWTGEDYRPGRADATRASVLRALKAAGYECQDIDHEEIRLNPFTEEIGLGSDYSGEGSIGLTPWDTQRGLVAVNPKTGKALVGYWFDLKEKKRLVLGLMPTMDRAVKVAAPLPDLPAGAFPVKDPNDSARGLPAPQPAFPKLARVPGRARGVVLDGSGRPVAGASLVIESSIAGGVATSVTATTNAKGIYDIAVPIGACRVLMAGHTVRYNDRSFALSLQPADGNSEHFASRDGHVENFVLRTWGVADPVHVEEDPKYSGHYYGGAVRVQWFSDDIPTGGVVEVTLTPKGPLVDGSTGRTLVYRLSNRGGGDINLNDIPIGRYVMTARFLENGKEDPLRVRRFSPGESDELLDSLVIDFKPQRGGQSFVTGGNIERFDTRVQF